MLWTDEEEISLKFSFHWFVFITINFIFLTQKKDNAFDGRNKQIRNGGGRKRSYVNHISDKKGYKHQVDKNINQCCKQI